MVRNLNEKNTQLQRQIESVVREGEAHRERGVNRDLISGQRTAKLRCSTAKFPASAFSFPHPTNLFIFILSISELERDLELERRKIHELQDEARERDKEYQKLKVSISSFLSSHFRFVLSARSRMTN